MARFYGQVEGKADTIAKRVGDSYIKCSAQSYAGSVITVLDYSDDGVLRVSINLAKGSSFYGGNLPYFYGTFEELAECFKEWYEVKVEEMK